MRKNYIELKPSDFCNIELNEIYVNSKFYTAIIGINFTDKRGKYTKYQFIHDNLHAIIEPDECAIRLFNRLSFELIELDSKELDNLLFPISRLKVENMEQLNSNSGMIIEANSTSEVLNVGAFFAFVKAYEYSSVFGVETKVKIDFPFTFDLYNKDNEKISSGTISPGEKATFGVQAYKMVINNKYDYEVLIVYSFGSGTVDQLKTDLELVQVQVGATS